MGPGESRGGGAYGYRNPHSTHHDRLNYAIHIAGAQAQAMVSCPNYWQLRGGSTPSTRRCCMDFHRACCVLIPILFAHSCPKMILLIVKSTSLFGAWFGRKPSCTNVSPRKVFENSTQKTPLPILFRSVSTSTQMISYISRLSDRFAPLCALF